MEKIEENLLFTRFGLCPDYKVMLVEGEWVEFYLPPGNLPLYSKLPDTVIPINAVRLHLDTHLVEMENNITASARFAVSHENKIIFLQVTRLGEIGRMMESYK